MQVNLPVKIWCSRINGSTSTQSFELNFHVDGDDKHLEIAELIEGTVRAVASQYFGTSVEFEHCATQGLEGNPFHKWRVTEMPSANDGDESGEDTKHCHIVLTHGLMPEQLNDVFPFHIVFDSSLEIVQCGDQCSQMISSIMVGSIVSDIFDIKMGEDQFPLSWEDIRGKFCRGGEGTDSVTDFCLTTTSQRTPLGYPLGLIGRLSFSLSNKVAVFLCHPDVSSLARMEDIGVALRSLSKSDKLKLQQAALSETLQGMTIVETNQSDYSVKQLQKALSFTQDQLVTKQSFVRYVSHEIRTPLMAVDIGLALLEKDLKVVLNGRDVWSGGYTGGDTGIDTGGDSDSGGDTDSGSELARIAPGVDISPACDEFRPVSTDLDGGGIGHDKREIMQSSLEMVRDCKQSMRVAIDILNDLLAYEKIESGVFQLSKTPVLASTFFKETVAEFKLQVSEWLIYL